MQQQNTSMPTSDWHGIPQRILNFFHVSVLARHDEKVYRFSGQTLFTDAIVLIEIVAKEIKDNSAQIQIQIHNEDFMFGGHLAEQVKKALIPSPASATPSSSSSGSTTPINFPNSGSSTPTSQTPK